MSAHEIVSAQVWRDARKALLAEEKEFTRLRDRMSEKRRALPWTRVEKVYRFDAPDGRKTLSDLFEGRGQLIVQHIMFAPESSAPCKSCSFWADHHDATLPHLHARDVALAGVSRAPLEKLRSVAARLAWKFPWVSDLDGFNHDFQTSFTPEELAAGPVEYNYRVGAVRSPDLPGYSVFVRDGGEVFHTYSCYARGLDMLNPTYHLLDLVPKGRDENPENPMSWVRLHDKYDAPAGR